MEQNQDSSLFGMNVDQAGRSHLGEAARWAKLLAIAGFIMCGFIVLMAIFFGSFMGGFMNRYGGSNPYNDISARDGVGAVVAIYYIVIAVLWFIPCLFLYRFSTKMKMALASNDQEVLNGSFQNLKATFRYLGIITIILLAFMVLGLLVIILGVAAGSRM
jgi:preprotein translocase subunit SecG